MMKRILLDSGLNFYKGNMHCHSTHSDGRLTPKELKALYKSRGYSFLAITDHDCIYDNSYLNDDDFLALTACEISIKQFENQSTMKNFSMKVCHLNLYAKQPDNLYNVFYSTAADHYNSAEKKAQLVAKYGDNHREYSGEGISRIIKCANDNGFFVSYNHSRWSLENYNDYMGYDGLWGVEIYNTGCNVGGIYEYDINVLDDMLRGGKRVFAVCGDDNHNRTNDSFGAFVMVNCKELTYDNIVDSLLGGRFYSSTGPKIYSLYIENGRVYIECSAAERISLSTAGRRSEAHCADTPDGICRAEFNLCETDGYFRIDVLDSRGCRADTQAYFLSDFWY
ncbi:MAG: PHP domain-containing protein [Clostridia bacterium]|nr:PHP domain-containing protein [Clostridia bacterium]